MGHHQGHSEFNESQLLDVLIGSLIWFAGIATVAAVVLLGYVQLGY